MSDSRFRVDRIITFEQLGVATLEGEFLSGVVQIGDHLRSKRGALRVRGVALGAKIHGVSITCDAADADGVQMGEILLSRATPSCDR